jgi:hypothetical protein
MGGGDFPWTGFDHQWTVNSRFSHYYMIASLVKPDSSRTSSSVPISEHSSIKISTASTRDFLASSIDSPKLETFNQGQRAT